MKVIGCTPPLQVAKARRQYWSVMSKKSKCATPHLMKAIEGAVLEPYEDPLLYPDINTPKVAAWEAARRGMYNVVNAANGTGRKAFADSSYRVARSGTAQVFGLRRNEKYITAGLKRIA